MDNKQKLRVQTDRSDFRRYVEEHVEVIDSTKEPTREAEEGENVQDRSDDGEKIDAEDLENATDKMNAKSKQRWLEYERSLMPPEQAMEELRLRGLNSPGASTSGNLNLNVNRTSRPKAKKKGKLSNDGKKDALGTHEELDAGRIVDPSGSVDPPHQKPELDKSDKSRGELDKSMKKFFACRYCDQ